MLDNLLNLVRENAQDAIVNNAEVPNEHNEAAMQAASSSIFDALKQQVSSGNLSGLADIFKGGTEGSTITQQATSSFVDKLKGMGVNLGAAEGLAGSLIPAVLAKFTQKTADPNDSSFDLGSIMSSISGPDGKFQLSDLTNLLGGSNAQGEQGGLLDKLKGLF